MNPKASTEAQKDIIVKLQNNTHWINQNTQIIKILEIQWLWNFNKLHESFGKLWIRERHGIVNHIMNHDISTTIWKKRLYTYIKDLIEEYIYEEKIELNDQIFEEIIIALVIYNKIKKARLINRNQESIEKISKNPFRKNCVDDRKHKSNELYKTSYPWWWLWLLMAWRMVIKKLYPSILLNDLDNICTRMYQELWWVSFHNNHTNEDHCSCWCGHIKHMIINPSEYECNSRDIDYLKNIMDLWKIWNKYIHVQKYWTKSKNGKEEKIEHKKDFAVITKNTNGKIVEIPNQVEVWSKKFQLFDYSEYIIDHLTEKILPKLNIILSEKWIQINDQKIEDINTLVHQISNNHLSKTLWYIWHDSDWNPTKQIALVFEN